MYFGNWICMPALKVQSYFRFFEYDFCNWKSPLINEFHVTITTCLLCGLGKQE